MNKIISWAVGIVAFYAAIIGTVALVGGNQSAQLGAATPGTRFPHGVTIGLSTNSPTNIGDIKTGTCNLIGSDASQSATTTASYDCAVSGVVSTDVVNSVMLSTSTINTSILNWSVMGAKASTTAGFITIRLTNLTGGSAAPSASSVGSSTQYLITKTQ